MSLKTSSNPVKILIFKVRVNKKYSIKIEMPYTSKEEFPDLEKLAEKFVKDLPLFSLEFSEVIDSLDFGEYEKWVAFRAFSKKA